VTAGQSAGLPQYWFSGKSTVVLGANASGSDANSTETVAAYDLPVDPTCVRHFRRGFLVVACLRYFGGLHSTEINRRADVVLNDRVLDGFALRVIPPNHSDYFHRIPRAELSPLGPFPPCQTVYSWALQKSSLAFLPIQRVTLRIDPGVRWDIDYVGLLLASEELPKRVFLSYSSRDVEAANELYAALTALEIGVWMDAGEMRLGEPIPARIEQGIHSVAFVAVLYSRNAAQSNWVELELELGLAEEKLSGVIKVLPIRLDDCELPAALRDRLSARLKSPDDARLVAALIERRLEESSRNGSSS
jgi:TIR domain